MENLTLDVRTIPHRDRHPIIFQNFDDLKLDDHFVLVNDHDPKGLFLQLTYERPDEFEWEYLEKGPDTWKIKISRIREFVPGGGGSPGGCSGCCCGE